MFASNPSIWASINGWFTSTILFASNHSIWASINVWFTPTILFLLLNLMIGTIFFRSRLSKQQHQRQPQNQEKQQNKEKQEQESNQNDPQQPKLARSNSVLERLKSVTFYNFRSQESTPTTETQFVFGHFHEEKTTKSQTLFFVEQSHEEKASESQTQFDFEQTHEATITNTQTHEANEEISEEEEEEDEEPQSLDEVYSQKVQLTCRHVRTTSDTKPASGEVPAKLPQKMRKSASMKSSFGHFEENDIVESRRPATVRERSARVTEDDEEVDAKADDFINKFKNQLKLQRLDSILRYKSVISGGSAT